MNVEKRMAMICFMLLVIFILLLVLFCNVQAVEEVSYVEYTVQSGDTVWSIASGLDRNENMQKTVCEIRKDNNNLDPMLKIGQVILIRN